MDAKEKILSLIKEINQHNINYYVNDNPTISDSNYDILIRELENSLSNKVGLNVVIKNDKKNKGTITFTYKEMSQLNKIIEILKSYY